MRSSALMKPTYGLLTMAMLVRPLMDRKDPGKVQNRRVAKSRIFFLLIILIIILVKTLFHARQLIHGCRYCSMNNTNELRLLVSMCFWVKKKSTGGQISSKNHCIRCRTSVFVSSPQPLNHKDVS